MIKSMRSKSCMRLRKHFHFLLTVTTNIASGWSSACALGSQMPNALLWGVAVVLLTCYLFWTRGAGVAMLAMAGLIHFIPKRLG